MKIDVDTKVTQYINTAKELHSNQTYGQDMPYWHHLCQVSYVLYDFGFTDYKYQASAWLHDALEDTEMTVQALIRDFGTEVAEIVIACTGEGNSRKERTANILHKLDTVPDACIVKCADRIANVEAGGKTDMYRKEQNEFEKIVKPHVPEEMWKRLEAAFMQVSND